MVNNPPALSSEIYSDRLIDRLSYAHDASLYRVVPEAVVRPTDANDVIELLKYGNETKTPITFRTAGTSLSGQSVGPGIIAETVRDWKKWEILDNGGAIRLQPGVIGGHANTYLSSYNRKIGPDHASINSCMIGGIVANNSSGMACGVKNNSYHTMRTICFITSDGKSYDTSVSADYERFLNEQGSLVDGINSCRKEIIDNDQISNKIRSKYRIKNTIGYAVNALIDYEHPLDIFAHLLIGSEGTLAFISEVVLNTIEDLPIKSTGLILFDDILTACSTIPFLSEQGASSLELMDYASLATVKYLDSKPYNTKILQPNHAGLLCEFESDDEELLNNTVRESSSELEKMGGNLINPFNADAHIRENLWKVRKGLYPTVGSLRKTGTSVIAEDICVHQNELPQAVHELHKIFKSWNYKDAVIFGHAKDGNLHFASSIDLNDKNGIKQFDGMMKDLVSITIGKFNGSLKAEHGTGRNMAPFVETEWGGDIYKIMWTIKTLADSNHILNPGVLLNKNKKAHLEDLKPLPLVDEKVDLCVECGFCESVCPSRNLTMTPRQRIIISREMRFPGRTPAELEELRKDFNYSGNETCATDGLCELECPVNIDTGSFIKSLRSHQHSLFSEFIANFSAKNFAFVQSLIRGGLRLGNILGSRVMKIITHLLRKLGMKSLPIWNPLLSVPSPKISTHLSGTGETYLYFPSCLHRTMGFSSANDSVINMLMKLAPHLGVKFIIPDLINSFCCGMPFASKGFDKAHHLIKKTTMDELYLLSDQGQIPILLDMSPCSYHISSMHFEKIDKLHFVDIIQFFHDKIDVLAEYKSQLKEVLIHHTCSGQKLQQQNMFEEVINTLADNVITPQINGCCGSAGDRGLLFPELTKSASENCFNNYPEFTQSAVGVSSSKMCELSMSQATHVPFYSIIEFVYQSLCSNNDN